MVFFMVDPADLSFLLLASVTILSALVALEAKELVYAAMALAVTFAATAGLFMLLGAFYVAFFQLAIRTGAVMVLILFVVMLIRRGAREAVGTRVWAIIASIAFFVVTAWIIMIVGSLWFSPQSLSTFSVTELGTSLLVSYGVALVILAIILIMAATGTLTLIKEEKE